MVRCSILVGSIKNKKPMANGGCIWEEPFKVDPELEIDIVMFVSLFPVLPTVGFVEKIDG